MFGKLVPVPSGAVIPERDIGKRPILNCINLGVTFGGLKAVDDFNLMIGRTEIAGLIGPNGAGKTTVFNLLTKVYQPTHGTILLDGQDTHNMTTAQVNRAGIARTFQNIRLFNDLTVEENVTVAMDAQMKYNMVSGIFRLPSFWKEEKVAHERALELLSLFHIPMPFSIAWVAIILCGVPIILEAIIGLVTAFDIKADVLVSLALVAFICIGKHFAAGEIAFIMQLGALLEDLTVAKARAGIEKLVHLTPQTARVLRNGTEKVIPAEQVQVQDLLRVLPGETIPVDGVITDGQTSINQAVMTGESLPVDKTVGDAVSSGTANQFGAFEMRATKVGADSSIQRMIQLV